MIHAHDHASERLRKLESRKIFDGDVEQFWNVSIYFKFSQIVFLN